ncbi:hypothetical protein BVG19_g406 [[Candida] boidinii]|nr:hypothetical protein BVG19_g406 [[Candida] boidinii]OWB50199.1 hypothetical protein B5S27_g1747 [[Candida] boidinii]
MTLSSKSFGHQLAGHAEASYSIKQVSSHRATVTLNPLHGPGTADSAGCPILTAWHSTAREAAPNPEDDYVATVSTAS